MSKKKVEIKGLEDVLSKLPESQREEARAAVLASLEEDFDPRKDKVAEKLARGEKTCPRCGRPLTVLRREAITVPGHGLVVLAGCGPCDQPYMLEASD